MAFARDPDLHRAVLWFAAAYVLPETGKRMWEDVDKADLRRWAVRLLGEYCTTYGGNQFRAVRRFLRWLAIEDDGPDPVSGLRAPTVKVSLVPVFTSEELSALRKACQGRRFADRRDAAILAVFEATGIRLSELAGIRYDPANPQRDDVNLHGREIRSSARAASPGKSRSASERPGASTGTCAPGGSIRWRGGRAVVGRERAGSADRGRDLPVRRQER
jgi:integrase